MRSGTSQTLMLRVYRMLRAHAYSVRGQKVLSRIRNGPGIAIRIHKGTVEHLAVGQKGGLPRPEAQVLAGVAAVVLLMLEVTMRVVF